MTTNAKYVVIVLGVLLLIGGAYYMGKGSSVTTPLAEVPVKTETANNGAIPQATTVDTGSQPQAPVPSNPKPVTTTPQQAKPSNGGVALVSGNTTGYHSFSSAEYGFMIKFPPNLQSSNTFTTFHEVGNNWRLNASDNNQGKAVVAIPIFTVDQGSVLNKKQQYPLYFRAEVRVGVSPNIKECYSTDEGYTGQKVTDVSINGVNFKKFSAQDSAMMKYVQSESYRTIHNGKCYVIEQIKNGSSYKDETMTSGIDDTVLANYYNTGATIVKTFKFTK